MTKFNISPETRRLIYIISGITDAVITYLLAKELIGTPEVALWATLSIFVKGMAGLNVNTNASLSDEKDQ